MTRFVPRGNMCNIVSYLPLFPLNLAKSKMLLGEITKGNDDDGSEYFGNGRVKFHILYQYLQNGIIQKYVSPYYQPIAH